MEWVRRMENVVEYLENNLEEELDMAKVARMACSSTFHFQRMFHMLTGVTVAEYVRKRRLTVAAQELAARDAKVIDTALKYGYETPESFSRAFHKLHGISPSAAREPGNCLKAFPRISFHISIRGGRDMDYRIMEKEAYRVLGKGIRVSTKDGENFRRIPEFWNECCQDGTLEQIAALGKNKDMLGICMDFDEGLKEFTYIIAVASEKEAIPGGYMEKEIPAAKWAVFESVGPVSEAIEKTLQKIFSEWFPATGYKHTGGPEVEVYPPGDCSELNYRCEIWVPVKK